MGGAGAFGRHRHPIESERCAAVTHVATYNGTDVASSGKRGNTLPFRIDDWVRAPSDSELLDEMLAAL
jgi:hypothetical protein